MAVTSTTTNTIGLTFEYDDGQTRSYTFTGMETNTLPTLINRVKAFNTTGA